jgi:uncharacterized protein
MKVFLLLIFFFVTTVNAQIFYGTTDLQTFRNGRDKEFKDKKESPLTETDFSLFKGIDNFENNKKFRVNAKFTLAQNQKSFQILTSSGKSKSAVKVGVVTFKINKLIYKLNAYQIGKITEDDEYKDLLFIPFKDLSNGIETYSGGRYIDIWKPKGNTVILDFNLAYNPSCAYGSDRYSCPIPPKENFLKLKVLAGEKKFVSPSKQK